MTLVYIRMGDYVLNKAGLTEKFHIRLSKEDAAILNKVAKSWRCDPVHVIRRAIAEFFARNGYLNEDDMKALGIRHVSRPSSATLKPVLE